MRGGEQSEMAIRSDELAVTHSSEAPVLEGGKAE